MTKQPKLPKVAPRRVRFLDNTDDFRLVLLWSLGRYNRAIARKTSLTPSQVAYRTSKLAQYLKQGAMLPSRRDWREGYSDIAEAVTENMSHLLSTLNHSALSAIPEVVRQSKPEHRELPDDLDKKQAQRLLKTHKPRKK